jgi:catechol 2,3-dioxygenase-like lactoylglutathione lyase family enzyme
MEVLSSRLILRPTELERTLAFYRDVLGLPIYREFGEGDHRGVVFFTGGGFLEISGHGQEPPAPSTVLWLQVRDLRRTMAELARAGVTILREARREPWGLDEAWIADPDGLRIVVVEVPEDHPLRFRPGT